MIEFEFYRKKDKEKEAESKLLLEDVSAVEILSASLAFGKCIKEFAENNMTGFLAEKFKNDALKYFTKGLKLDEEPECEKSEDDIKRAIEKVLEKLAEVACKEEL